MAHNVETMAYAGQVPWHGLGTKVPADLSPIQMQQKAGLDWTVSKHDCFINVDGKEILTGQQSLIRDTDQRILTNVGANWNPVQNSEAFEFFSEYCQAGDMEMHTAGSLKNGEIVWVLAKVNESFDVLGDDQIDSYLLFSNPHQYGKSLNVRFTPIRVVCNNTLTMSLNAASNNEVKLNHRRAFNPDMVKEQLGIAHEKFEKYKEIAQFLSTRQVSEKSLVSYFNNVFPVANKKFAEVEKFDDLSRTAKIAYESMETQPGSQYAPGSYWQALNAVTYTTDHLLGRSADARMTSAWFGANQTKKQNAVNLAMEMAA